LPLGLIIEADGYVMHRGQRLHGPLRREINPRVFELSRWIAPTGFSFALRRRRAWSEPLP
jgi:hypothetical protein